MRCVPCLPQVAEHVEQNNDQIADAIGTAQQQVTGLAAYLRIASTC